MAADLSAAVGSWAGPASLDGGGLAAYVYEVAITQWLRRFYFKGPIWKNVPAEEICFQLTGTRAAHWTMNADNMKECADRLEQQFEMWDNSIMTVLWFAIMAFTIHRVLHCICYCEPCQFLLGVRRRRRRREGDDMRRHRHRYEDDPPGSSDDGSGPSASDGDERPGPETRYDGSYNSETESAEALHRTEYAT